MQNLNILNGKSIDAEAIEWLSKRDICSLHHNLSTILICAYASPEPPPASELESFIALLEFLHSLKKSKENDLT